MKIFFITVHFPKGTSVGGAEIQCLVLAKYLAKRGHQTTYLALKERQGIKKEQGIKSQALMRSGGMLRALGNFYKVLKKEKPDVCYIRSFEYLFILNLICKLIKVKVVYNTTHINNCTPYQRVGFSFNPIKLIKSLRASLQHYLSFKTLKKVNLLTINKLHAKILNQKYNIKAQPIYNSMEDNYRGNVYKKKNNIVWVNNIKPRKNPEIFTKVANEFKNKDWRFLMIGEIQWRGYFKKLKSTESKNSKFKYLGAKTVKEVDRILADSKVMINTCEVEGFGNNFIQAWLAECPTVTLKFDPDNIIKNNKIGFHSKTFKQMIKDLKDLMTDDKKRIEMGKKARKYASKEHNINKNVLKYESFFNKI